MQTFNRDNSYIVMERGKFLSTSSCLQVLCRVLTMTIPILSWNVASSSVQCQFFLTIFLPCLQVPLLWRFLTMTISILSWNVASSSVLCQFFLTNYLSCLQVPLLCRLLTMTIPILSWNVASSSVLCQFFLPCHNYC